MSPRENPAPRNGGTALQTVLLATLAIVPAVFSRATFDSSELPKSLVLILAALLILGWSLGSEASRLLAVGAGAWVRSTKLRLRSRLGVSPIDWAVAAFVGSALLATVTSVNPWLSFRGAPESCAGFIVILATAVLYFATRLLPGTPSTFSRLCAAAAIATMCADAYALVQLTGHDPIVWGRRAAYGETFRVFGTLGHPNLLGAYLVMTLPLIAYLGNRARSILLRAGLGMLGACSLAVILATLSRGALIGLAAVTAVSTLLLLPERERAAAAETVPARRKLSALRWTVPLAIPFLVLAFLTIAGPSLRADLRSRMNQIANLSAPSTQTRLEIWSAGLRIFADRPVVGTGLDTFSTAFPRFRTSRLMLLEWGVLPARAHNEAIHTLATQGIVGAAALLLLVLTTAKVAWGRIGDSRGDERWAAVAAAGSLAGFAAQGLVSYSVAATGSLAAVLAGWLAAASRRPWGQTPESAVPGGRSRALIVAGVLAALLLAGPFLLQRWRSEVASFRAVRSAPASRERIAALARAVATAPWDSRFKSQLGREYLNLATAEEEPEGRLEALEKARANLSSAVKEVAPERAYDLACLGQTLAAEWSIRQDPLLLPAMGAAFREAVSYDPANAEVMLIASEGYASVGQRADSREVALRCADMYPRLAMPLAILGFQALEEGRLGDAADTLTAALGRDWQGNRMAQAMSWNSLSAAYLTAGDYEQAIEAARRALALEPGYRTPYLNIRRAEAALEAQRSHPR